MEDWDVVAPTEVATNQQNRSNLGLDRASFLGSLTGSLTAHVGKTVSQVSKAMGALNFVWNLKSDFGIEILPSNLCPVKHRTHLCTKKLRIPFEEY